MTARSPVHNGRIGLVPAAFRLWGLASLEHNAKRYFSAPVTRVCEVCGIEECELTGVVCELELGGLCQFEGVHQGVLVLRVVKRAWVGMPKGCFEVEG